MKIEAGKLYKNRKGYQVSIYTTTAGGTEPIHGAIYLEGVWRPQAWRTDGLYLVPLSVSDNDIISEWSEPKPRMLAWRNSEGEIRLRLETTQPPTNWERAPHLDEPIPDAERAKPPAPEWCIDWFGREDSK